MPIENFPSLRHSMEAPLHKWFIPNVSKKQKSILQNVVCYVTVVGYYWLAPIVAKTNCKLDI